MQTLMENQTPDLPLQWCVETSTIGLVSRVATRRIKNKWLRALSVRWKTPVAGYRSTINDQRSTINDQRSGYDV